VRKDSPAAERIHIPAVALADTLVARRVVQSAAAALAAALAVDSVAAAHAVDSAVAAEAASMVAVVVASTVAAEAVVASMAEAAATVVVVVTDNSASYRAVLSAAHLRQRPACFGRRAFMLSTGNKGPRELKRHIRMSKIKCAARPSFKQ